VVGDGGEKQQPRRPLLSSNPSAMECSLMSLANFLCEELWHHLFTFFPPEDLVRIARVSYLWHERVNAYLEHAFQLWHSAYVGVGGDPQLAMGKIVMAKCNWGVELSNLRSCMKSCAGLFHYATQKKDLKLIKTILDNNNEITANDIAAPVELDGDLFEWNTANREWVAYRCILKDKFVYIFEDNKLARAIEVDKELVVMEIVFRPKLLFLIKTPNTLHNFRAPSQHSCMQWIKMLSNAKAAG